uniref:ANK_REP_REGION domain-containing protein n=1 Tax=Parascaris equorum TaxID=6256 RepID=A0A914RSX1_PAREQ
MNALDYQLIRRITIDIRRLCALQPAAILEYPNIKPILDLTLIKQIIAGIRISTIEQRKLTTEDCVRLLGRRKSFSVTARNNRGRTALHLAIMSCNSTVVDLGFDNESLPYLLCKDIRSLANIIEPQWQVPSKYVMLISN